MAPSIQQLPEEIPVPSIEKLAINTPKPATEAVKAVEAPEAPKVKKQIDLEGGKTDAKVSEAESQSNVLTKTVPPISPNMESRAEVPSIAAIYSC